MFDKERVEVLRDPREVYKAMAAELSKAQVPIDDVMWEMDPETLINEMKRTKNSKSTQDTSEEVHEAHHRA